jgi:hypothetical protein
VLANHVNDQSPTRLRVLSVALVSATIGIGSLFVTIADVRTYAAYGLSHHDVHPTAVPIALGPGLFGLLLIGAAYLMTVRRPVAAVIYSLALLVGGALLALRRFNFVGVERPSLTTPPSIFFFTAGVDDGTLWTTMDVAAIGLLSLLAVWIPDPIVADPTHPPSVSIGAGST